MKYKKIKEIDNPNDLLVIVNKQNKLPDNFTPSNLVLIPKKYCDKKMYIKKEVLKNFIKMYNEIKEENLNITIISAYRNSDYQENLYNNYVKEKGKRYADRCSARKNHSEHQTGLAIDIMGENMDYNLFDKTKEYLWMKDNSHKYGFILRYPKKKEKITGFKFEPWHYRYVGIDIATQIYNKNITLEEYKKISN